MDMSNLKICGTVIVIRANAIHGDSRTEKLVDYLARISTDVVVLCWDRAPGEGCGRVGYDNVTYVAYSRPSSYGSGLRNFIPMAIWNMWISRQLRRFIGRGSIIYACDFDSVVPAFWHRIMNRKRQVRIIYDVFDCFADSRLVGHRLSRYVCLLAERYIAKYSDWLVLPAKERLNQLGLTVNNVKNLNIIYNTPPPDLYEDEGCLEDGGGANPRPVVVFVGMLGEGRFIEGAVKVAQTEKWFDLHIAGYGSLATYIAAAAEKNENINYHGRITYHEAMRLSERAMVLFAVYDPSIPNHKFSSPNKFFESLLLGKPLIVAKGSGIDVNVCECDSGFVMEYGDAGEFSRLLHVVHAWSQDERAVYGRRLRILYHNEFSWKRMEERYDRMFSILGDGSDV